MLNQIEIGLRTYNHELTSSQAGWQTLVNGVMTPSTAYLGTTGISTGATTLSTSLFGLPAAGSAGTAAAAAPVVGTIVGVTSLAYVAPIAQGTANNVIEGQPFLPAWLGARKDFHNSVIGEELTVSFDEKLLEPVFGPPLRFIGDVIIDVGNNLQGNRDE